MKLIDSHAHVGFDWFSTKVARTGEQTPENLLAKILKNRVDKSVIFPFPNPKELICPFTYKESSKPAKLKEVKEKSYVLYCETCKKRFKVKNIPYLKENKEIIFFSKNYPKRFVPFIAIDPRHPRTVEMVREFGDSARGIKIHPFILRSNPVEMISDELMKTVKEKDLSLLFHSGIEENSSPLNILKLAEEYEEINIIIAHCARLHKEVLRKVSELPNLYIDSTLAPTFPRWLNRKDKIFLSTLTSSDKKKLHSVEGVYDFLVSIAGGDKILFGTDVPFSKEKYSDCVKAFKEAEISPKEKIAYKNAQKLIE